METKVYIVQFSNTRDMKDYFLYLCQKYSRTQIQRQPTECKILIKGFTDSEIANSQLVEYLKKKIAIFNGKFLGDQTLSL